MKILKFKKLLNKISELPLRHKVFPTSFVDLLEISEGVSPLPASWGMARVAQKKHLFCCCFLVCW